MKKIGSCLVVFFLFVLVAGAQAFAHHEGQFLEHVANQFSASEPSAKNFSVSVTRDGRTTPRPGPVFTQGYEEEGTHLPHLFSTPKPITYPRWAMRQGWQGTLILAVEILENGTVGRWQVTRSTGYRLLDKAAVKAVREWRFEPAKKEGKPFVACIQIPVHFTLEE